MLFLATLIVNNPWLKIVGALYLIRLAFDNLGRKTHTLIQQKLPHFGELS